MQFFAKCIYGPLNIFAILFQKEIYKGKKFWNFEYLTLESVKQDKCTKYNGSIILLYPTQQFTVSSKIQCHTGF